MQVNATSQRPRSNRSVALRIRALPASIRRASFRVFSWVLILPSRGKVMWWRSGSIRITPVVNENALAAPSFRLESGEPLSVVRGVCLSSTPVQLANDSASARHALAYTSLEFCGHQGATVSAHGDSVFASVPLVAQRLKRPPHTRGEIRLGDPVRPLGDGVDRGWPSPPPTSCYVRTGQPPACDNKACSCAGVGSSANRYA